MGKKHKKKAEQGQLKLVEFMGYQIPPSVHTSDTSIEAAQAIKPHQSRLAQKVYEAIEQFGPLSDEGISRTTGMNPNTARPRRVELLRDGLIVKAGYGETTSGRPAALWSVA